MSTFCFSISLRFAFSRVHLFKHCLLFIIREFLTKNFGHYCLPIAEYLAFLAKFLFNKDLLHVFIYWICIMVFGWFTSNPIQCLVSDKYETLFYFKHTHLCNLYSLGMSSLLLCVLRMLLDPENMGLGANVSV